MWPHLYVVLSHSHSHTQISSHGGDGGVCVARMPLTKTSVAFFMCCDSRRRINTNLFAWKLKQSVYDGLMGLLLLYESPAGPVSH